MKRKRDSERENEEKERKKERVRDWAVLVVLSKVVKVFVDYKKSLSIFCWWTTS